MRPAGVGLHVPRPYRSPYLPGMTALIPHFEARVVQSDAKHLAMLQEPILMSQEDLYSEAWKMLGQFPSSALG